MVKVASEEVDHRRGVDHIGVSVSAVVHDGKGNILLMKRGPKARDEQGRWDICGGAIEFGESLDEALEREIVEELCVRPTKVEFLTAYEAHREHEGVKTHWISINHAAQVDSAKVKIGEPQKIAEIGWFTNSNLPSPLHSQLSKALNAAKAAGVIK